MQRPRRVRYSLAVDVLEALGWRRFRQRLAFPFSEKLTFIHQLFTRNYWTLRESSSINIEGAKPVAQV
jgi:hypothetical protein